MDSGDDGLSAAAITYGLTMTAAAICFAFCWFRAASARRLIAETADRRRQRHLPALPLPTGGQNFSPAWLSLCPPARRMRWVVVRRNRQCGRTHHGSRVQRVSRDHHPSHLGNAGTVPARSASLLPCCGVVPGPVSIRLRHPLGAGAPRVPRVQGPPLRRCSPCARRSHAARRPTLAKKRGHRRACRICFLGRGRARTHDFVGPLAPRCVRKTAHGAYGARVGGSGLGPVTPSLSSW